jgi:hypothetical protein
MHKCHGWHSGVKCHVLDLRQWLWHGNRLNCVPQSLFRMTDMASMMQLLMWQ